MTDEERACLTEELLHKQPERYGADRAAEYFDRILGAEQSLVPDSETVKTREDAGAGSNAGIQGCNKIHAGTQSETGTGNYQFEINGSVS